MAFGSRLRAGVGTLWRGVVSAVQSGVSAFDFSGRVSAAAQAAGLSPTLIDTSIIDQLAGFAHGIDTATGNLSAATDDALIDSSMISLAPWSMDLNQYNTNPQWRAQVEVQYVDQNGEQQTTFRWVTGITDLSMTVGDLRSQMRTAADVMSIGTVPGGGVGGQVTGIGSISLTVGPA